MGYKVGWFGWAGWVVETTLTATSSLRGPTHPPPLTDAMQLANELVGPFSIKPYTHDISHLAYYTGRNGTIGDRSSLRIPGPAKQSPE